MICYESLNSIQSAIRNPKPEIKNLSADKPDFVPDKSGGYHLSGCNITVTILLPTLQLGRAALKHWFTWHYSTQGLPENIVTYTFRELLPHIFTLILIN